MENLNAEKVKDRIELCFEKKSRCEDCTIPPCLEKQLKNALALIKSQEQRIKELAEEKEKLIKEIDDLNVSRYMLRADGGVELIPTIKSIKADTVRKMKTMIAMRFGTYTDKDMTPITEVFRLTDQIAKEMLEGDLLTAERIGDNG